MESSKPIVTKPTTDEYRENWEKAFGKKQQVYEQEPNTCECIAWGTCCGSSSSKEEKEND